MALFNFFGSIFGYVLWPIFYLIPFILNQRAFLINTTNYYICYFG